MVIKKLISCLLTILLILSIPYSPTYAGGAIGTIGIIPSGGSPGEGGGLYKVTPAFRVGIVTETFRKPIDTTDLNKIRPQIIQHYVNHFPNMEHSIIFSPSSIHHEGSDIVLGWYNLSDGGIHYIAKEKYIDENGDVQEDEKLDEDGRHILVKKHRLLDALHFNQGNIFYHDLKAKVINHNFKSLGNGVWRSILPERKNYESDNDYYKALEPYEKKSAAVWSYLLKDWNDHQQTPIDNKLDSYTKYVPPNESNPQDRLNNQIGYLDLLMTLYVLSPDEEAKHYAKEIERYINGEELDTNPPLIAIDTAVRVKVPAYTSKPFYLPSTSYLMYDAHVTSSYDLCDPNAPTFPDNDTQPYESGDHTKKVLTSLIQKSVDQKPDEDRISDLYGNAAEKNGFNWGQSGVCQDILRTTGNKVNWYDSSVNPVMKALTFNKGHYGFVIVSAENVIIPTPNPPGGFSIISNPKEKILEEGSKTIKSYTEVTLKSKLLDTQEVDWIKALDREFDDGFPKIIINLKSTSLAGGTADTSNTYDFSTSSKFKGNGQEISLTKDELESFILGETTFEYRHDLVNYPVNPKQSYTFNYEVSIQVLLSDEITIDLQGNPSQAETTYHNPEIIIYDVYHSTPVVYSEIKQGSPGNETFEAMAGTPTTRNLYFASGGSEFIVHISTKYCPDLTTERTYKSYFTGTPSEFKDGDQADNYTVGGFTLNGHSGGSRTKTWSGSIPWTGSHSASGWHGGGVTDSWDYSSQQAALSEAEAYAAQVNGTTITHTAASDGKTRTFNSWNASVSGGYSDGSPGTWTDGRDPQPSSGSPGKPGYKPAKPGVPAKSSAGSAGSYSYSVTVTLPAHRLCGPDHENDLPLIQDTWKHTITYDIRKIDSVSIWKIDRSHVDGMSTLTETDEITATVVQGDPNIFYNIAANDTSADGRIRYSLEPEQHDTVVWNEGVRSNTSNGLGSNPSADDSPGGGGHNESYGKGIIYTNDTMSNELNYHENHADTMDKSTPEYVKFAERRNQKNIATVISDFVILQTSSGDQSLIYFEKASEEKTSQESFDDMQIEAEEMWIDNPESAAKMEPEDINIGSYNGNYSNPAAKYKGNGDHHQTVTILDNDPAKTITRPARPSNMRLMKTNIDVIDTIPNDEYITGESTVFYRNILKYGKPCIFYHDTYQADYGLSGLVFDSTYSDSHSKVNDIVIHNPVSAEDAMVVSLDSSLDQRSAGSLVGGNLQSDVKEYVTELKDIHPHQNFLFNGDAEQLCDSGHILNWKGEVDNPEDVAFLRRISNDWKINGKGSFEIRVPAKSNRLAKYVCTTVGEAGVHYNFSGKIGAHRAEGYFTIEALNANGKAIQTWQTPKHTSSQVIEQSLSFTAPNDTIQLRVSIVNGLSHNTTTMSEYVFADDLLLTKANGETAPWVPIKYSAYEEISQNNPGYVAPHNITNPEYIPAVNIPGTAENFNYTGSPQTFTAPYTGEYTLEAWGAAGGNYSRANGGYGTYVKTTKTLNKGDSIYVYVGGQGKPGNSTSGGWNGGGKSGACSCGSSSGGGATDFRTTTSTGSRFLVAGGAGGAGTPGNHGRSSIRATMSNYIGQTGASSDGGGGGGGYRGGYNGGTDMGAYAGSSFVNNTEITSNVSNSSYVVTTGSNSGHGRAKITLPPKYSPAVGEPTILVNNAYYVPAVVNKINGGTSIVVVTPAQGEPYIPDLSSTIRTVIQSDKTMSEPPDDWYETKVITIPANPTVTVPGGGNFTAGNFLLLDYPFQVYFPNEGDFYGTGAYGLSKTSNYTGKGFTNNMSTTEWTSKKVAKFGFAVIHKGILYPANTEISLKPINDIYYDFYLPLGNKEALSAFTEFYAVANNAPSVDNRSKPNNKKRHSHKNARHSALREYNIDVIGRIGNLIMEDTGDYRFSNFFKEPVSPQEWYIPNVVYKVAMDQQREYLGPIKDIRNFTISPHTNYLNTYGSLDFLGQAPKKLPLSPSVNNIAALQRQPLRYGYPILMDIQTTGNYYSKMQIIPYYYHLNLQTGDMTPIDVYIKEDTEYKPINKFGAAVTGWDPSSVYDFKATLDWQSEADRRNYDSEEQSITEYVQSRKYNVDETGNEAPIRIPLGQYHTYGNAQIMHLSERNRTFIGTSYTYGDDKNPNDALGEFNYNQQAQRWHFTFKLPSSAIFTPHGQSMTKANIDSVMNNNSVIIAAADIKAVGDTYVLQYEHPTGNGSITIAGTTHSLDSIPYSVYAIYSAEKSAANDLSISGSH